MLGTKDREWNVYPNSEQGFRKIPNNKTIDSKSKYLFLVSDFNEIFFYRYRNRMHLDSVYHARRIFKKLEKIQKRLNVRAFDSGQLIQFFFFIKEKVANIFSLIIFSKRYQ